MTLRARGTSSDSLNLKGTLRPVPLRFSASMDAADLPLEWLGPPLRASTNLSPSGRLSANLDATITEEKGKDLGIQASGSLTVRDLRSRTPVPKCMPCSAAFPRTRSAFLRLPQLRGRGNAVDLLHGRGLNADKTLDILECVENRRAKSLLPLPFSVASLRLQDAALLFGIRPTAPSPPFRISTRRHAFPIRGFVRHRRPDRSGARPLRCPAPAIRSPPLRRQTGLHRQRRGSRPLFRLYAGLSGVSRRAGAPDLKAPSPRPAGHSLDNHIRLKSPCSAPRTRPGAPDYPVSLGFALLEHRADLPISGRLDDAALQVGGLVGKALGGLFTGRPHPSRCSAASSGS
ncbi:MAG: DUF748 domain-containing protein [Bilophila wadsworthia]